MTLGDLLDLVTTKVHRTDEPSRAEARKYIASRYQMIYESYPWRDACEVAATPISAAQTVILPHIVDRVIGVRWSSGLTLRNESLWTILQIDPAKFDQAGDPVTYTIYSPSAVAASPGGQQITVQTTIGSADFSVSIYGSWQGRDKKESITLSSSTAVASIYNYDEIHTLSKYNDTHDLTVRRADNFEEILHLEPAERERNHQRLHFHSTPTNATSLLVLYKRHIKPLINDSDATEIKGMDNALLSCAIADMRESERQYGKASQKLEEGVLLVKTMADLERHQSENVVRLIPIISDNEDYHLTGGQPTWFER
jgi:hypothetical protein